MSQPAIMPLNVRTQDLFKIARNISLLHAWRNAQSLKMEMKIPVSTLCGVGSMRVHDLCCFHFFPKILCEPYALLLFFYWRPCVFLVSISSFHFSKISTKSQEELDSYWKEQEETVFIYFGAKPSSEFEVCIFDIITITKNLFRQINKSYFYNILS